MKKTFENERELKKEAYRIAEQRAKEANMAETLKNRKIVYRYVYSILSLIIIYFVLLITFKNINIRCDLKNIGRCKAIASTCDLLFMRDCYSEYMKKACNHNDAKSCFELATFFEKNSETLLQSRTLHLKSCQLSQEYCHKSFRK